MESNLFTQTQPQMLNEVSAVYRINPNVEQATITSSRIVSDLAKKLWPVDINHREAMIAIYLNRRNVTVGYNLLSIGGIAKTLFHLAVIVRGK